MDIRLTIIQAVSEALQGRVTDNAINTVQDVLTMLLNNYEIQEHCTDVAVLDTSAQTQLKKNHEVDRGKNTDIDNILRL